MLPTAELAASKNNKNTGCLPYAGAYALPTRPHFELTRRNSLCWCFCGLTHTRLCLHEVLIAPFLLKMNNWVLNHLTLCDFLEIWMRFPCATMQGCPWPYINVDASSAGKSAGWGRGLNGTSSSEMPAEAVGSSDCSSDDACSMLRQGVWISSGIRVWQNFPDVLAVPPEMMDRPQIWPVKPPGFTVYN